MTWSYSAGATAKDNVRLIITDIDGTNAIFSDEEITAFLTLNASNTLRAAAMALDTIASSEVLVLKVIRLLDLTTDGAKVADALRKHAASLREQAVLEDEGFDIAEMVFNPATFVEKINKEALR